MLPIEFRYNGRHYKTLTNTFGLVMEAAIINKINDQLAKLKEDILRQGGQVLIKMIDGESYKVEVSGISEELQDRVGVAMLLN